jgi:hypothetical protein
MFDVRGPDEFCQTLRLANVETDLDAAAEALYNKMPKSAKVHGVVEEAFWSRYLMGYPKGCLLGRITSQVCHTKEIPFIPGGKTMSRNSTTEEKPARQFRLRAGSSDEQPECYAGAAETGAGAGGVGVTGSGFSFL